MKDHQALSIAIDALRFWGVSGIEPRLIKNRENAVFEAVDSRGQRTALRLHRPGYQSQAAIRSELVWSEGLARAGMDIPLPVRTLTDDIIAELPAAGRVASMVSWMDGVPLGEGGEPFAWQESDLIALYRGLGEELAKLHQASDALKLPDDFCRQTLDINGLLGESPLWGRFWENLSLTPSESALLQRARSALKSILSEHQSTGGNVGLIHADALRENVLVQDGAVKLIDFDDGGFGFRMYDLGVAMSQNWDLPNADAIAAALIDGYRRILDLDQNTANLLPAFTVVRALASCGWAMPRYAPDSPVMRHYADRAIAAARRYLDGDLGGTRFFGG